MTAPACVKGGLACSYRRDELAKADALWAALTEEREQSRAYRLQLQAALAAVAALEARCATHDDVLATLDAAVRIWRGGQPEKAHVCASEERGRMDWPGARVTGLVMSAETAATVDAIRAQEKADRAMPLHVRVDATWPTTGPAGEGLAAFLGGSATPENMAAVPPFDTIRHQPAVGSLARAVKNTWRRD